jgi:hypothetical protein
MSRSRREIERLLSKDELELVTQAKLPALTQLSSADLSSVSKRLRDARDRAQTIAQRQRREMRGKAAPSGAQPASDNTGSMEKSSLLAAAMQRVNKETSRRRALEAKTDLVRNAREALARKQEASDASQEKPKSQTAGQGMRSLANKDIAPSGALEQEGFLPVLERSRKVR